MEPQNRFQGMNSASLWVCSLAGRYYNPVPPRYLAPVDSFKIPALMFTCGYLSKRFFVLIAPKRKSFAFAKSSLCDFSEKEYTSL